MYSNFLAFYMIKLQEQQNIVMKKVLSIVDLWLYFHSLWFILNFYWKKIIHTSVRSSTVKLVNQCFLIYIYIYIFIYIIYIYIYIYIYIFKYIFKINRLHKVKMANNYQSPALICSTVTHGWSLALSWQRSLSYRNQSIDLLCKSTDWFLYDRYLHFERANTSVRFVLISYCFIFSDYLAKKN